MITICVVNIILFARLVSKAKELSHISTDDRRYNDILLLSQLLA